MPDKLPKPPSHLSAESAMWFGEVVRDFQLEPHHLKLLTMACECWDRAAQARQAVESAGLTYKDRHGNLRPHPGCQIERDNRVLYARLLRELALDVEEPAENRPPTIHGNAFRKAE